jgi:lipopolysaccharide export system permease protein
MMKVRVVDRYLIKEFIKYTILAVLCVVVIYQLIDLFEELDYFINQRASVFIVVLYYLYSTPAVISLMLPVGILLSCFFVYGILTRERAVYVFQTAGVKIYRLFAPVIVIGIILVAFNFFGYELITIPTMKKLDDLRLTKIERKTENTTARRRNLYVRGKERSIYFIQEYESAKPRFGEHTGTMKNFVIIQYTKDDELLRRIDGSEAVYKNNLWLAKNVSERTFESDSIESYKHYDTLTLAIVEKPGDFTEELRDVEELSIWELHKYINQLRIAGANTAKSEVEYNYRFASSFIGIILILLGLPLAVQLRRGGVMFGLGLGLLFSFIYWGSVQITKAFGQALIISPFLSAWLANFVFLIVGIYLLIQVKQ